MKIKKPSYLNYFYGEVLIDQRTGMEVRFLRWTDTAETKAEVGTVDGLRPLPQAVDRSRLSRPESIHSSSQRITTSEAFNSACQEARQLLGK